MDNYFDSFKEKMQNRFRISRRLVEDYEQDIYFMVECDKVHIQIVRHRVAWVKPLEYEVNINDTKDIIKSLLNELVVLKLIILEHMMRLRPELSLR